MDDGDERPLAVLACDRDGERRLAVQEVDRAVERVDHPAEPARTERRRPLLAEHGVIGSRVAQQPTDRGLGVAIGIGHGIGLGRLVREAGRGSVQPLAQQVARGAGGALGERQELRVLGHGGHHR